MKDQVFSNPTHKFVFKELSASDKAKSVPLILSRMPFKYNFFKGGISGKVVEDEVTGEP